jgi:hypothetical protein
LEYFDNESRAWFSSGALLSTSTNGFYKMWDDVNVGNPHRLYRVVGCLNEFVWVDDQSNLPGNAVFAGEFENWNWVSGNPSAFSGTEAHQSTNAGGMHQHYFHSTTDRLSIQPGDVMFCYVYLNPSSVPATVMLQWADDISGWVHRAYWGANNLAWGVDGTGSRRRMGDLPPAGQWVRLEVPANLVDLVGRSVHGMAFTLWDGQATWDDAGKKAGAIPSDALAAGD